MKILVDYSRKTKTYNGWQYISVNFKTFCKQCGIEQVTSPPNVLRPMWRSSDIATKKGLKLKLIQKGSIWEPDPAESSDGERDSATVFDFSSQNTSLLLF